MYNPVIDTCRRQTTENKTIYGDFIVSIVLKINYETGRHDSAKFI